MEINYDTHLKPSTQLKKEKGEEVAIHYLFNLFDSESWTATSKYLILDKMRGYYKKASQAQKERIEKELESLCDNFPNNSLSKCSAFEALHKLYQTKGDKEKAYYAINAAISSVHPEDTGYCWRMYSLLLSKIGYLGDKDLKQFKYAGNYFYWFMVAELYRFCWVNFVATNSETEKQFQEEKEEVKNSIWPFEHNHQLLIAFVTLADGKSVQDEAKKIQFLFFSEFPKQWDKTKHQTQIVGMADNMINNYLKELVSKEKMQG